MTYMRNLRHRLLWATASLDSSQTASVNTQTLAIRTLRRPLLTNGLVRRGAKAENNYTWADKAGRMGGGGKKVNIGCRTSVASSALQIPLPRPLCNSSVLYLEEKTTCTHARTHKDKTPQPTNHPTSKQTKKERKRKTRSVKEQPDDRNPLPPLPTPHPPSPHPPHPHPRPPPNQPAPR